MNDLQMRVLTWAKGIFGDLAVNKQERALRLLEEATELAQALEVPQTQALRMVDEVYQRKVGRAEDEMSGVALTASACAGVLGLDLIEIAEAELQRIETPEVTARCIARQDEKRRRGLVGDSCEQPLSVRIACRLRYPLSGTDAQALEHAITITERERDEAMEKYRFMVERAADEKLDGYRELGARAAAAEEQRNEALSKLQDLRAVVSSLSHEMELLVAEKNARGMRVVLTELERALNSDTKEVSGA